MNRDLDSAERSQFDAVVIGAGILGIHIFSELSSRGLRTLLIERDDFAGGSTLNSLRILHGGLRYLQSADLPRFLESVRERRWYCGNFPDMVQRLPFVLLLEDKGLRRASVMRVALAINDILSINRNIGLIKESTLPGGRVLSLDEISTTFPELDLAAAAAGALWYDAWMAQPVRIVMELLKRGCRAGGLALNRVEAVGLETAGNSVTGVRAVDRVTGAEHRFSAPLVVNATGPWAKCTAHKLGISELPDLPLAVAWNVLIRKSPIGDRALVFVPPGTCGKRSYVMVPRNDNILIGTGQAPFGEPQAGAAPSEEQLEEFLNEIRSSLPMLDINADDISHVFSGLTPASAPGSAEFASRPWIVHHAELGGPRGVVSAAAVKFTTARAVSLRLIRQLRLPVRRRRPALDDEQSREATVGLELAQRAQDAKRAVRESDLEAYCELAKVESAVTPEDLVYRRLGVTDNVDRAAMLINRLRSYGIGWADVS